MHTHCFPRIHTCSVSVTCCVHHFLCTQAPHANLVWCRLHPVPGMTTTTSSSYDGSHGGKKKKTSVQFPAHHMLSNLLFCNLICHLICIGVLLLTLGGVSIGSQKTSSDGERGENGDKGEMAISDIELLWGASRLERRLAFWEKKKKQVHTWSFVTANWIYIYIYFLV